MYFLNWQICWNNEHSLPFHHYVFRAAPYKLIFWCNNMSSWVCSNAIAKLFVYMQTNFTSLHYEAHFILHKAHFGSLNSPLLCRLMTLIHINEAHFSLHQAHSGWLKSPLLCRLTALACIIKLILANLSHHYLAD